MKKHLLTQGTRATHEGEERVQGGREVEQAGGQGVEEEEQEKQEQGPQEQQKVILLCDVIIVVRCCVGLFMLGLLEGLGVELKKGFFE